MDTYDIIDKEIRHHTIVSSAGEKQPLIDTLHAHLDVVDTKTSVLLTFNGLLITIFSVLISFADLKNALPNYDNWAFPLMGCAILIVLSTLLCLSGLNIIGAHSNMDNTYELYIRYAAKVSISRTKRYLVALLLTSSGCIIVLAAFLFSLFHIIL